VRGERHIRKGEAIDGVAALAQSSREPVLRLRLGSAQRGEAGDVGDERDLTVEVRIDSGAEAGEGVDVGHAPTLVRMARGVKPSPGLARR
jgi:hypothetical protein